MWIYGILNYEYNINFLIFYKMKNIDIRQSDQLINNNYLYLLNINMSIGNFFSILLIFIFALKLRFTPSHKTQLLFQTQKIIIQRDQYSIANIKAQNRQGFLYGLGYVFAEDRLFQMHVRRTLASGRLSEIAGNKTLDLDIFFRELGFRYWGERIAEKIQNEDPQYFTSFKNFISGINDFVKENGLPLQFYLLWIGFEQWKIADSIVICKLIQWAVSNNIQEQYVRSLLLQNQTIEQIKQYFPYQNSQYFLHPKNSISINNQELIVNNLFADFNNIQKKNQKIHPQKLHKVIEHGLLEYLQIFPELQGSNIWVVDGNYTQSGRPIFSWDPHFDNSIPSQWYPVAYQYFIEGRKINYKGVYFSGTTGITVGKSNYATWGVTVAKSDVQDLYLEKIEGDKYFFEGQWRQLKIRPEIIKVKGQPDIIYNVKSTHRGPILSRLFARGNPYFFNDTISLAWTGHNSQYVSIKALTFYHQIQNYQRLLEHSITKLNYSPNMNLFHITNDDHLYYIMLGRLPLRSDPQNGVFVKDGTVSEYDWKGFITSYQKPHLEDPKKGYILNANNKPANENFKSGIYAYSVNPTGRANRLEQLIRNKIDNNVKMTTRDMMDFQLDTVDVYCRQVLPHILERLPQIRVYLNGFSCNFTKDSYQATVYEVFFNHLKKKLKGTNSLPLQSFLVFDHFAYRYLSGQVKHREVDIGLLKAALQQTISFLRTTFKDDNPISWKWGKIHRDYLPYRIFSASPLRSLFQRSIDGRGNNHTPNMGLMNRVGDHNYDISMKPNLRMVSSYIKNSSWWILDTGVSESFLSDHFTDLLLIYQREGYIKYQLNDQGLNINTDL